MWNEKLSDSAQRRLQHVPRRRRVCLCILTKMRRSAGEQLRSTQGYPDQIVVGFVDEIQVSRATEPQTSSLKAALLFLFQGSSEDNAANSVGL